MSVSASRKLLAVRQLHEHWNVPLDILGNATGLKVKRLEDRAARECWQTSHSAGSLLTKLISVFHQQLEQFSLGASNEGCEEKRARALSILAKTLESVATVGVKTSTTQASHEAESKRTELDEQPNSDDANRTAELDRQLAELVQKLT